MTVHKPVLLQESINALNLKPGDTVIDATLGGGGHSLEIIKHILPNGKLIAIDRDAQAIENFKSKDIFLINDNFADLDNILKSLKIEKVNAILADLGYSSDQMDEAERGFSFLKDAELDMRMDKAKLLTAKKIINEYSREDLEKILREYGEEKFYKSIAEEIFKRRKIKEIRTTVELAEIIKSATPKRYHHQRINPATKTFQALRIEVNQELENLKKFIPQAIEMLKPGGRLAIISFHSLEDRIVKNMFRENARGCICPPNFPQCRCGHQAGIKIIAKKPIIPTTEETESNPRSRSAKMRICERI